MVKIMVEIRIEKRKSIWLWAIIIIVISAAIVYLLSINNVSKKIQKVSETEDLYRVRENIATINAFVVFVETDTNTMSIDHGYTNEALLKLVGAIKTIADELDYDIETDMDRIKTYAEVITNETSETTHANNIRKAAELITKILQNIQQAKYPELSNEVIRLNNATLSIKSDLLTLDQKDSIKSFFKIASDLFKKMN